MEGWNYQPLQKLCKVFVDGDWVETKDQSISGIRLIQTGNIGEGYFKDRKNKARYISDDTFKRLKCEEIYSGDILISRLPDPVGRCCIIPDINQRMITAVDCTIIRLKEEEIVSGFFKYYSLSKEYLDDIDYECTGTTRKRISRKKLGKILIPLPPLEEQKRIVALLDAAFAGIETARANAERNLANARALFESYLNGVFTQKGEGWEEKRLVELIEKSGTIDPRKKPDVSFQYVDVSSVSNKTFRIVETSEILGKDAPSRARRLIESGDVIFATVRPTLRRIAVVPPNLDQEVCSTGYFVFRTKPELKNIFLYYFLFTERFMDEMESLQTGTSYPAVNDTQVKNTVIPLPPHEEQIRIAKILDQLANETRRLASIYEQKLAALAELKQSLLHKAFSGALTAERAGKIKDTAI